MSLYLLYHFIGDNLPLTNKHDEARSVSFHPDLTSNSEASMI